VKLTAPFEMNYLKKGFDVEDNGFQVPAKDGSGVKIVVDESSDRLQLLEPGQMEKILLEKLN
jgi:aconitate hydratase